MAKFLFVTDLDNTLVGDDNALTELNDRLHFTRQEHGSKIVYATGRSPVFYQELKDEKKCPKACPQSGLIAFSCTILTPAPS